MKYPSHEFLINRWLIHNQFVGLGNSLEVVVYCLLIRGMVSLGYQDGFLMVSVLVYMVTHLIGLMVSHDIKLSTMT